MVLALIALPGCIIIAGTGCVNVLLQCTNLCSGRYNGLLFREYYRRDGRFQYKGIDNPVRSQYFSSPVNDSSICILVVNARSKVPDYIVIVSFC